jgi:hypothetical protein
LIDGEGRRVIEPGEFQIAVGGRQPTGDDFAGKVIDVLTATIEATELWRRQPSTRGVWPCPTHWALALVQLHAHCERRILPLGHGAQTFFFG